MVSALSLLFEKVSLPRNLNFVKEFARKYQFAGQFKTVEALIVEVMLQGFFEKYPTNNPNPRFRVGNFDDDDDPLSDLTDVQKETANLYLMKGIMFALAYKSLFPEVFETQLVTNTSVTSERINDENEESPQRKLTLSYTVEFDERWEDSFPTLVSNGYIPVIGSYQLGQTFNQNLDEFSARQIATLLAMKSVEIIFPRTKRVHPEVILEARYRLSDHLPPFWSSMLKLSVEMRGRIKECGSVSEVFSEAQNLVDTLVMPSLIDLQQKMMREKKDWFYKILSPIQKGLKLMIGNPPLTQQQLLTNALLLGSDVIMSAAENMRAIDMFKNEAGLTFLLEAQKIFTDEGSEI
jgi:hypothetical protein